MLTDTMPRNLKPRDKQYKVADQEGLYVAVSVTGAISFRYNYRLNGRSETLTFGRYGPSGITLAQAQTLLREAKQKIAAGVSPAQEKARSKDQLRGEKRFDTWARDWLHGHDMADSTRDMRRALRDGNVFRLGHGPHQVGGLDGGRASVAQLTQVSHDLAQQRQFFL